MTAAIVRLWPRRREPPVLRDDLRELIAIYDRVPPEKRQAWFGRGGDGHARWYGVG